MKKTLLDICRTAANLAKQLGLTRMQISENPNRLTTTWFTIYYIKIRDGKLQVEYVDARVKETIAILKNLPFLERESHRIWRFK